MRLGQVQACSRRGLGLCCGGGEAVGLLRLHVLYVGCKTFCCGCAAAAAAAAAAAVAMMLRVVGAGSTRQ